MSFIGKSKNGGVYAPGYFLVNNESCTRKTAQIEQGGGYVVEDENGAKYAPMGSIYPANDGTAKGIIYEDVDVTFGDMPGSVVYAGSVYKNRLPNITPEAEAALKSSGFVFVEEDEVVRPY